MAREMAPLAPESHRVRPVKSIPSITVAQPTVLLRVPSRSTVSVTRSPCVRKLPISMAEPPPTVPLPKISPGTSSSSREACAIISSNRQCMVAVLESVQGPVAKIVAVIIIIVTGLTLAFGETAGGFRRLIQIVFGLSIAFAASSFFLSFFSFGGGALVG